MGRNKRKDRYEGQEGRDELFLNVLMRRRRHVQHLLICSLIILWYNMDTHTTGRYIQVCTHYFINHTNTHTHTHDEVGTSLTVKFDSSLNLLVNSEHLGRPRLMRPFRLQ